MNFVGELSYDSVGDKTALNVRNRDFANLGKAVVTDGKFGGRIDLEHAGVGSGNSDGTTSGLCESVLFDIFSAAGDESEGRLSEPVAARGGRVDRILATLQAVQLQLDIAFDGLRAATMGSAKD